MLKEAVEEIEEKVANLKALISLIKEWEARKSKMPNSNSVSAQAESFIFRKKGGTPQVLILKRHKNKLFIAILETKYPIDSFIKYRAEDTPTCRCDECAKNRKA